MTYKLNPELKKICAPIIVRFTDGTAPMTFPNGEALTAATFSKKYLIDSISTENNSIVLTLRENDTENTVNWTDEKAVSFF